MRYGTMNFPVKPVVQEIEEIGPLGFDFVELAMDPPEATPERIREQKKEITQALGRYELGLVGHLPTFVNTASLYKSLRQASLEETLAAMEVGVEVGVEKLVVHPSYISGLAGFVKQRAKEYALESLQAICDRAEELGTVLCLENLPPKITFWTDPVEFEEVFTLFPKLKLALDVGHANIGTWGGRPREFLTRLGNYVGHLHFSDNLGRGDDHLPVGVGTVAFKEIIRDIVGIGYDDTLTIEVFAQDRGRVKESKDKVAAMYRRFKK